MMITSTLIIIILPEKSYAEKILAKEYFLKAAFLYNFSRLVDWPEKKYQSASAPFNLCLMGNDPFGKALRSIRNKKVQGHPLIIRRFINLEEISECEILFISQSEKKKLTKLLNSAQKNSVLTVSEITGFAQQGGHIRFYLSHEKKLKLEINPNSIANSGLKISSRILTLATLVSSSVSSEETVKP